MSATKSIHPDEKFKADKAGSQLFKIGAGIGLVFLAISLVLGVVTDDHWRRFFHAYLIGWSFVLSIAIGGLGFILIHHIARAKYEIRTSPILFYPAAALAVTVLSFILLGDAVRDALDPKERTR